jgi:hypothetical protein
MFWGGMILQDTAPQEADTTTLEVVVTHCTPFLLPFFHLAEALLGVAGVIAVAYRCFYDPHMRVLTPQFDKASPKNWRNTPKVWSISPERPKSDMGESQAAMLSPAMIRALARHTGLLICIRLDLIPSTVCYVIDVKGEPVSRLTRGRDRVLMRRIAREPIASLLGIDVEPIAGPIPIADTIRRMDVVPATH